jgi:hypothetical protein
LSLAAANIAVSTAAGDDIVMADSLSGGGLRLDTAAGDDIVAIHGAVDAALDDLNLQTGRGDDLLTLGGMTGSRLRLNVGRGDDTLDLNQLNFDRFFAQLGQGDDLLDISPNSNLPLERIIDPGQQLASNLTVDLPGSTSNPGRGNNLSLAAGPSRA